MDSKVALAGVQMVCYNIGMGDASAIFAIAHRGASSVVPENTVAAFDEAIRRGARAVEFDVRLSSDGVPMVIHDDTLDRTTSGRGYVRQHTWDDMIRYDAGSWMHARFAGTRMPTLDEALRAICPAAMAVIELKEAVPPGIILQALQERNARELATVISFDFSTLSELRKADRDVGLGLLADTWKDELLDRARFLHAEAIVLSTEILSLERISAALDMGLEVWTYTPNDVGMVAACAAMGVSGMITDSPELIREKQL